MAGWRDYLLEHEPEFLKELLGFCRIPSISALSLHAPDVRRAADWVAARMRAAGIEGARVLPTGGHPAVYGEWLRAPGTPTVLVYGHFDTQPVDPLELWTNPPFDPVVRNGRVYARGASDDKGNMLIPILAAEAMLKAEGRLPINLKFLFEGEEEIGSPSLGDLIAGRREAFACDLVISSDGGQWSEDQPALLVGLRGVCSLQVDLRGASSDLHSGIYGGTIQNPIHALAELLASMRNPHGRVLVEGFYDNVVELTRVERDQIAAVPHDDGEYRQKLAVDDLFGEPGYTTLERAWVRPTLEVNGIWGGFQGEGTKTVLPAEAHAKITCRLVPDQEPGRVYELVASHIQKVAPPGVKVAVRPLSSQAPPYTIPADHPGNRAAGAVLEELYGVSPCITRTGGTIPASSLFLSELAAHTVVFAFGLGDEAFHAPDEFFRQASFERGQVAYCKLFERLSQQEGLVRPTSPCR